MTHNPANNRCAQYGLHWPEFNPKRCTCRPDKQPDPITGEPMPTVAEALDPRRRTWWTAADLMATTFPEPRWAVPDLLAEGVTLLAGQPKVGKSWLSLGLAVAVAAGGKALGDVDVEQGDVLYLALEDNPRRMQDRLAKVLKGDDIPRALTIAFNWEPERVLEWLAHRHKRLMVIDVLARVRAPMQPGSVQYDHDYSVMRRIKSIADDNELAVAAVHHTRKAAADDFLNEVSGTNGLSGGADAVLVLKRMRGTADAELHVTGRDVAEAEYALSFDPTLGIWTRLAGAAQDYKLSDTRARILEHLAENGSGTPKQIAEALGLAGNTVKQRLWQMFNANQVDSDGSGLYLPLNNP